MRVQGAMRCIRLACLWRVAPMPCGIRGSGAVRPNGSSLGAAIACAIRRALAVGYATLTHGCYQAPLWGAGGCAAMRRA